MPAYFKSLLGSETIQSVLDSQGGIGRGFDYLRIALAVVIFQSHAGAVAGNVTALGQLVQPTIASGPNDLLAQVRTSFYLSLVPMFFAVSGFLVAGSAYRLRNVRSFLIFRALRIFPALTVEVVLSAFVLGSAFTVLSLDEYYSGRDFFLYFGNILGFVHYRLPGVFNDHPYASVVNANLWTLPGEFYCYLLMSAAMIVGLLYSRRALLIVVVCLTVLLIAFDISSEVRIFKNHLDTSLIVYYFVLGVIFFQWRDIICINWYLVVVAVIAVVFSIRYSHYAHLTPLFLTYITVAIGTARLPELTFMKDKDYSYGIYLYGFPIEQASIAAFPWLKGHSWWTFGVAGTITLIFAVASWHAVERPALRMKRMFSVDRKITRQIDRPSVG